MVTSSKGEIMKKNSIFREKTLNKVSSPESLNDYICIVKPGVWAILGAIIVLIVGTLIWVSTLRIATDTVKCAAVVKNNEVSVFFNKDDRSKVEAGMEFVILDKHYKIPDTDINGRKLYKETDGSALEILGDDSDFYYCIKLYIDLPNGVYESKIISADINPLELIFD